MSGTEVAEPFITFVASLPIFVPSNTTHALQIARHRPIVVSRTTSLAMPLSLYMNLQHGNKRQIFWKNPTTLERYCFWASQESLG
jgi:hypothetical protein